MNVKEIKLTQIKPYWRNPRINDKTVNALVTSIQRYGFNVPLVVDKKLVIITGHARYKALTILGWESAPCVVSDMDDKKAREYRIADNTIQEQTEWDSDLFNVELRDMTDLKEITELFGDIDIDAILSESVGRGSEDFSEEDVRKAETRLGEQPKVENKVEITCPHCGEVFYIDK